MAAWACRFEDRAESRQLSLRALELAHDGHAHGLALRARAFCDFIDSAYELALEGFTSALEIALTVQDQILERDCLNFIGGVCQRLGDFTAAIEYTRQAFEANIKLNDEPAIVYSLNNFGILHREIGEHREAVRLFEDALERARRMNDATRQVTVIVNLGEALPDLGRSLEAVALLREGLQIAQSHGLDVLQVQTLANLADALTQLGQLGEAIDVYARALELIAQHGPPEVEVHCLLGIARIHLRKSQSADAIDNAVQALQAAQQLRLHDFSSEAHDLLAQIHASDREWREAFHHLQSHHTLEQQRREDLTEQRLRAVNAQFKVRRARSDAEIERLSNVDLAQALRQLEQLDREKSDLLAQLEINTRELERLAFIDPLTGLANRRQLETSLTTAFDEAQSAGEPLTLAMMDIDDFKDINDRFAHQIGDEVLVQVARLIQGSSRVTDLASRYGGEEFILVLPNTSDTQAFAICEDLRARVELFDWSIIQVGLRVTLSIGACSNRLIDAPKQMIAAADSSMYAAKRSGKNCVVMNGQ